MYASGSTWLFNAVLQVAAVVTPARHAVGRFVTRIDELGWIDEPGAQPIVKTHDVDAACALLLSTRADAVWVSVRDPRDCVTSLMLYQRYGFDAALDAVAATARFCARHVSHPAARLFRYEIGFVDDPATLDTIARSFGGTLTEAERARIFTDLSRPAVEALIDQLDSLPTVIRHASGDVLDPATQWHRHHAHRTGEIGRWRKMLTARQIAAVEHRLQDWMAAFGYKAEVAPYRLVVGKVEMRR